MSDPSLVQISFTIKPEMPKDMKKYILDAFTDYYKYYPDKQPSHEEYLQLMEKYPEICDMQRNDAYHNVDFQTCKLSEHDLYDLDTEEIYKDTGHFLDDEGNEIPNPTPDIGVCILSLPRYTNVIDKFLKLIGPYIYSRVSTIGICHYRDYGNDVGYYYIDKQGQIRKHLIEQNDNDEIISTAVSKKYPDEEDWEIC